jgi:hypothetical protein
MEKSETFMSIGNLIDELLELNNRLEEGKLSTEEVVKMCELSRDLFERLVIIRHRSYEEMLEAEMPKAKGQVQVANEPSEQVDAIGEEATESPKPSSNQISLIDSIEEIKRMEVSLNEKLKEEDRTTLKEQLKKQPIEDLPSSIGINQRFRFISVLFNDDGAAFEDAVEKLNSFSSFIEADEYVQNNLKSRFDWQMKDPAVKEMIELIERRYL